MLILAIVVAAFAAVTFMVMNLSAPASDKNVITLRMRAIARAAGNDTENMAPLAEAELGANVFDRILRPSLYRMGTLALKLTPGGATESVRMMLVKAGNPGGLDVLEFSGTKLVSAVAFFFIGIYGQTFVATDPLLRVVVFGIAIVLGIMLPDIIVQRIIEARQYSIRKHLPDTIDLLVVSVEAGMGFDGAVQKVVEKMKGPIADEFGRALHEMRLGKTRGRSLKDMALRIDVAEVSTFVAAIYQSEQLGVSISNVLRVQSESIRIAHTQRVREAAATLPLKMLFPLIFFIFPSIFVVLLAPGFLSIMHAFKGF